MEQQPGVEILIHIRAPSKAADDARYRSLAAAYLAFAPIATIPVRGQRGNDGSTKDGSRASSTDQDESIDVPLEDRPGSFHSLQASFRSVVDNAESPRLRIRDLSHQSLAEPTSAPATQASWETPPSVVQDSHPLNHGEFASLTSPARVLENYLQYFESPASGSKQDSQSKFDTPYRHLSQSEGRQLSSMKFTPSNQDMIPCSPDIKNAIVRPPINYREGSGNRESRCRQQLLENPIADGSDGNVIEETILFTSSQPEPAPPAALLRADSEPAPKVQKLSHAMSPRALARAASDITPQPRPDRKAPVTIEFLGSHGFTYVSLEIRPPEPTTSEQHLQPSDLITRGLRKLGNDVGLSSRFRPKEQTRDLRAFERGYWVLDCSSWEPQLKRDAWAFLANYVGTGIAGWGVSCVRDADFRELRAYCWGSVVAHVYYILWLSSQRKIVFTGSSWIDAMGVAVIVMGSKG
ncbi:hypothetical protein F4808DRAFT_177510 [Astrocystis sublimbata]|nr:hypothetical protein F4808DRAFT_177510 [Astrocystis sublimbata]